MDDRKATIRTTQQLVGGIAQVTRNHKQRPDLLNQDAGVCSLIREVRVMTTD